MAYTPPGLLARAFAGAVISFVAACGGETDSIDSGATRDKTTPRQSDGARGSATLTIGDASWAFDNFYCARGGEETRTSNFSFRSGAIGSPDGMLLQLDASIQDPSEEDRIEGEGVIHSVSLVDIEGGVSPSVHWTSVAGSTGENSSVSISVRDKIVTVTAMFEDLVTDGLPGSTPGRLDGLCGEP
jgi:hypothetical protein